MKALDVDLIAVTHGMRLFRHYARRGGHQGIKKIVITSSAAAFHAAESIPLYTVAKLGVSISNPLIYTSYGPRSVSSHLAVNSTLTANKARRSCAIPWGKVSPHRLHHYQLHLSQSGGHGTCGPDHPFIPERSHHTYVLYHESVRHVSGRRFADWADCGSEQRNLVLP